MILFPQMCLFFLESEDPPQLVRRPLQPLRLPNPRPGREAKLKVTEVPRTSIRFQNLEIHLLVIDTACQSLDVVDVFMFWALVAKYPTSPTR